MQSIEINVKVTIGMENALLGLISKCTENREAAPEAGPAPKPRKQAKQVEQEPQPKPEVENPQASGQDATAPVEQQVAEPAPTEPAEQPAQKKEYKEQPDSEGYKKWHKVLTGWFKKTAAFCGAEKPSALPDSQSRYQFIQCCEHVKVENDELVENCPF